MRSAVQSRLDGGFALVQEKDRTRAWARGSRLKSRRNGIAYSRKATTSSSWVGMTLPDHPHASEALI